MTGANFTLALFKVRANYGRFSVAICNDKGITDWSVNCMAPRSLRIMQDRWVGGFLE